MAKPNIEVFFFGNLPHALDCSVIPDRVVHDSGSFGRRTKISAPIARVGYQQNAAPVLEMDRQTEHSVRVARSEVDESDAVDKIEVGLVTSDEAPVQRVFNPFSDVSEDVVGRMVADHEMTHGTGKLVLVDKNLGLPEKLYTSGMIIVQMGEDDKVDIVGSNAKFLETMRQRALGAANERSNGLMLLSPATMNTHAVRMTTGVVKNVTLLALNEVGRDRNVNQLASQVRSGLRDDGGVGNDEILVNTNHAKVEDMQFESHRYRMSQTKIRCARQTGASHNLALHNFGRTPDRTAGAA